MDHLVGQFPRRPVRHRPPRFVRRFAGHRQDPRDLLGRELAAAPGPRQIPQHFSDGLTQRRGLLDALDHDQPIESLLPALPPDADAVPLATQTIGDRFVLEALEREQDDLGPVGEPLRTRTGPDHRSQDFLLTFADNHLGCHPWHDLSSEWACEDRRRWQRSSSVGRPIQPGCTRTEGCVVGFAHRWKSRRSV